MNDNKKVFIISNSNTKTLDDRMIVAQEEISKRSKSTKTLISVLLIMLSAICIILFFYLLDGLGKSTINSKTTTMPVTLNGTGVTETTEKIVYTPRTTVQSEATHTYSR